MAFIVPTKKGTFEIRESRSTPAGPRSRTLATFQELTDETIERAQGRAAKRPSAGELREAALRAGAPVAAAPSIAPRGTCSAGWQKDRGRTRC